MSRTISGSYPNGVVLMNAADNPVTIAADGVIGNGSIAVALFGNSSAAWTIANQGTVQATGAFTNGIVLANGGTVTNGGATQTNASISGTLYGVNIETAPGLVVNSGTISSSANYAAGAGVRLGAGGTIINGATNLTTALITGGLSGAVYTGNSASALVVNYATIVGLGDGGIGVQVRSGGTVINGGVGDQGALITSPHEGIAAIYGAGTVINDGTITATQSTGLPSYGIFFAYGGSVTNGEAAATAARISGTNYGILIKGGAGTVTNDGTIADALPSPSSAGMGIKLLDGGTVVNGANNPHALISDTGAWGVYINGAGTVVNDGTIRGGHLVVSGTAVGGGVDLVGGGTVTNGTSGNAAASILGYTTGVSASGGAGTIVNYGSIGLEAAWHGNGVYLGAGGAVTNQASGVISGAGYAVLIRNGAATITNAGTINGTVQFASGFTNRLIVDPGAAFGTLVNAVSGTNTLELAAGGTAGLLSGIGTQFLGFGAITFDAGSAWKIVGNTAGLAAGQTISGFSLGSTIELTGVTSTGHQYASGILTITESVGSVSLILPGSFTTDDFSVVNGAGGTDITILCFLPGTRIATPDGEVAVEKLREGGLVRTLSGAVRRIAWIGQGRVLATRGRRNAATPIIVRKSALAPNVPNRDLRVTKGHSLHLDGVLIPVEFLVNHRTILWDDRAQEVTVFHVELDTHDVLVANGAPAESYRDDGNRWLFRNANSGWHLPPKEPCAPVLTGGAVVDAVWRRLLDRAGPRPGLPLTDDPDLHLLADGRRIDAARREGDARVFVLPCVPSALRIASRAAAPQELGLARDPRVLGVAVRRIEAWQGRRLNVIQADDPRLTDGFHAYEADDAIRWTDGDAAVSTALFEGLEGPVKLVLRLGGTTSYADDSAVRRSALAGAGASV